MTAGRHMSFNDPKRARGVTLIELMIVIVVVAILASIAVPSYRNYILRTNRTEGRAALLRVQVAQEKFFLQNNTYTLNLTAAPPAGLGVGNTTPEGHFGITVVAGAGGITTSYLATATAAGGQMQDTVACRVLTINDQGVRTPAESSGCWR
ncbi:MAG: type IV pilin protein [Gammaproteobacteria bacterium]